MNSMSTPPPTIMLKLLEFGISGNVKNKAVSNVIPNKPVHGFVDTIGRNNFDVTCNIVFRTEIHHILGFLDTPYHATCHLLFPEDEREGMEFQWLRRSTDDNKSPGDFNQIQYSS